MSKDLISLLASGDSEKAARALRSDISFNGGVSLVNYTNLTDQQRKMVLDWRNDPKVRRFMLGRQVISPEEHKSFIESLGKRTDRFYWVLKSNDEFMGSVNIFNVSFGDKRCSWGQFANPAAIATGVGLVLEYFMVRLVMDVMNFHCLRCETFENNASVLKVHEFFGFKVEGRLRDFIRTEDGYEDMVITSLFESEWADRKEDVSKYVERLI